MTESTESVERSGIEDNEEGVPYTTSLERKVLIQPYDYAVRTLMEMVIEGELILDPDYQRKYRWPNDKASRFIESILLNIPVPVFYFAEEKDGAFSVIDGQQRLTSLFRFIKPNDLTQRQRSQEIDELVLEGLKIRADLNGRRYSELSREDKSTLSKRPMRCIVVLNESDETLKFEVFERLNSGSTELTDQEVRNSIYRGSLNNLIKKLTLNQKFQEMIALPASSRQNMKDSELVLRFFAYREFTENSEYSDSYTEYLNKFMEENRYLSSERVNFLETIFESTIDCIYDTLGPGCAFRKPIDLSDPFASAFATNLINGSIYESQMIAFSRLIESGSPLPSDLRDRALSAFCMPLYLGSIFQGTSQRLRVLHRSRVLTDILAR